MIKKLQVSTTKTEKAIKHIFWCAMKVHHIRGHKRQNFFSRPELHDISKCTPYTAIISFFFKSASHFSFFSHWGERLLRLYLRPINNFLFHISKCSFKMNCITRKRSRIEADLKFYNGKQTLTCGSRSSGCQRSSKLESRSAETSRKETAG